MEIEQTAKNQQGLAGIRLLELGGGVGLAWFGKLFADLGADVVRYEGVGDRVRQRPHDVHRWLNANKRSATTGWDELVAGVDVVVHDLSPSAISERAMSHEQLATLASPRLVVAAVTPFGTSGPYADYVAEELNLIHAASWGFLSPSAATDETLPPLKAPGHHASILVANVAAAATLAAFDRAERTGVGAFVDFSSFAAAAKMTETAIAGASYLGEDASRLGVKTVLPWSVYECADGMMQVLCVEQPQWEALVELMGNPEWAQLDVFATLEDRQDNTDLLDIYLGEWLATQKVDELYLAAQATRIPFTPVNSMAQIERHPQYKAREFFATTPDGLTVPGAGFKTDQPWWNLRTDAPELGQHDGEGWLARKTPEAEPAVDDGTGGTGAADEPVNSGNDSTARPLEGVRVCDFTWVWAGPFCTQYLAHLGADVIRLESPDRLCLFRRLAFNPPDQPLEPDSAGVFHTYNSDKRSVGIDLQHPDAHEIIRRLVATSDVVIDNFGVGVMASLGYGVDDLRAINPDVIVASLTGYGQTGPSASYMAYGPAGGAFSGLYSANGYEGGLPAETGIAVGDPCTGITALWSVVSALVARRRNGEVARIDVAMVEAVGASIGEIWMEYLATGESPTPRSNRDAMWAPHGCYPAAGDDEWISIACTTEEAWRALAEVIAGPGLADDERFATMERRKANEDALDEIVWAWSSQGERWERCRVLQAVGVAALPSISPLELWQGDPQLEALDMLERPEHPVTGSHVVPGLPWRMSTGPNGLRRPAPMLGQHNEDVLVDLLGFSRAEVEHLQQSNVLK
ncbi:MAG: CoA transferase [Acidimicrobiales bacterium]